MDSHIKNKKRYGLLISNNSSPSSMSATKEIYENKTLPKLLRRRMSSAYLTRI